MPSITSYLRQFVTRDSILYECRNCGETLANTQEQCPMCGSTETAEFDFLD